MINTKKYGAIDIGSNAARLLIGQLAEEDGHTYVQKVSYTRLPLRLGEEVFDNGEISEHKIEDFVKTMKAFSLIADIFKVNGLRACATSAMRDAKNADAVIERVKNEAGINIEVITGDEEARLIFGTFSLLDISKEKPYLVIDVGGGSTEINVFEHGQRVAAKSFDIGTVRMLKGKVDKKDWKALKDWIKTHVEDNPHTIYGTGGNINKIHKLVGLKEHDPLRTTSLNALWKQLAPLSIGQRMEQFQLKPDRADVIVPALEIYSFCMKSIKCKEIYVPKIGLSDGIIYDLSMKNK